eukprot:COSAG05_NODE_2915_length_2512_cov_4.326564_3_plen_319_part_00
METCRDHMGEHPEIALQDFEDFEAECLDQDGLALVEYALDLINQGCTLDLNPRHLRQMSEVFSSISGWGAAGNDNSDGACPWDVFDDYSRDVSYVCCGADSSQCPNGAAPDQCSPACAVAFHQFTRDCASTMASVIPDRDPRMAQITDFERACVAVVDSDPLFFLDAILYADCPLGGGGSGQESCVAHLHNAPDSRDGLYQIVNGDSSYVAFCDMANGGWELAMRVQSSNSEFVFSSESWTNEETFGDIENTDPAADVDTKWESFYSSPVQEIRGCLGGLTAADCKVYLIMTVNSHIVLPRICMKYQNILTEYFDYFD